MLLPGCSQRLVTDDQASDRPGPRIRNPQGSVLGPVVFLISDLPDNLKSSVRLFADNRVLYRNITFEEDCRILQQDWNNHAQLEADAK